ncbi:MAG: helix-turn-helix transcriptional regulator [Candidatus Hydrogenedentes bacterium]|nr:helix-turn-helix transcriptional regulator [Candidatus Hydrogenedentota bacterium]
MSQIDGNELRGHLETLVLAALSAGEAHGYEILQRLEARGEGVLHLKEGSLYPALYRLEEAGHVRAHWQDDAEGRRGPRRRIYQLTRKGKAELARRREHWRRFVSVVGGIVEASS